MTRWKASSLYRWVIAFATASIDRCSSAIVMTASRTGWTNWSSHWLPNPAPPASGFAVRASLFCKSSAMVMALGNFWRTSEFIHWSRLKPSGRFGSPSARTLRMYRVMSMRRPSTR